MNMTISMSDLFAPVVNNVVTQISIEITESSSSIVVADASKFPSSGVLSIGYEVIRYSSIQGGNVFLGCTRGFDGTSAVPHDIGEYVELRWVAAHHNSLAQAIVDIESTLGATITGAYATVNQRLISFEATSGVTIPASGRLGAMHYKINRWYIYNGVSWEPMGSGGGSGGDTTWSVISDDPFYLAPLTVSMSSPGTALVLPAGTLSDSLNSLSGQALLGRDRSNLSYRTQNHELVQIVEGDRLAAPRIPVLSIDYPEVNKISGMTIIPSGLRDISNVYFAVAGTDCSCEVGLCKLTPDISVNSYSVMMTISATVVGGESIVGVEQNLGDWNDYLYTIGAGDILFTKVNSISGSPGRAIMTVEAPYIPLGIPVSNTWQNTTNTGPEMHASETGEIVREVA